MKMNSNNCLNIAVLSSTRADYGLLAPVAQQLSKYDNIHTHFIVTGTHLSKEYGMTVSYIEDDGFEIAARIPILADSTNSPVDTSSSMARAILRFSQYFHTNRPNALILLGDRFETLAVCIAAFNEKIPVIHLHGGEKTEGAADDAYRHCITKMSSLHFTSTEEYRQRVIQLGEQPDTVFCTGAVGVENIRRIPLLSKKELENSLGFVLNEPYVMTTYHPTTLDPMGAKAEVEELLKAIHAFPNLTYLITQANADHGGTIINERLQEYAQTHNNVHFVKNLGTVRYLSAMKYAAFALGNSSSAIIETPSFKIPTINIGNRQKGRTTGQSVIHCKTSASDICQSIETALSEDFRNLAASSQNPYEQEGTSERIAKTIIDFLSSEKLHCFKSFYDLKAF